MTVLWHFATFCYISETFLTYFSPFLTLFNFFSSLKIAQKWAKFFQNDPLWSLIILDIKDAVFDHFRVASSFLLKMVILSLKVHELVWPLWNHRAIPWCRRMRHNPSSHALKSTVKFPSNGDQIVKEWSSWNHFSIKSSNITVLTGKIYNSILAAFSLAGRPALRNNLTFVDLLIFLKEPDKKMRKLIEFLNFTTGKLTIF